jgi:hypothetical protein
MMYNTPKFYDKHILIQSDYCVVRTYNSYSVLMKYKHDRSKYYCFEFGTVLELDENIKRFVIIGIDKRNDGAIQEQDDVNNTLVKHHDLTSNKYNIFKQYEHKYKHWRTCYCGEEGICYYDDNTGFVLNVRGQNQIYVFGCDTYNNGNIQHLNSRQISICRDNCLKLHKYSTSNIQIQDYDKSDDDENYYLYDSISHFVFDIKIKYDVCKMYIIGYDKDLNHILNLTPKQIDLARELQFEVC